MSSVDQKVPKVITDVTVEWMRQAMNSAFPEGDLNSIEIETSVGDLGYMGSIGRVLLSYTDPTEDLPSSVIIKFPAADEAVSKDGNQIGAYETETLFYRRFANSGVGRAPRHYFSVCEPSSEEFVLIVEDLKGLRFVSQTEGASMKDCRTVIKALAKIHGAFWESDEVASAGLGDIKDWENSFIPLINKGANDLKTNFGHLVDTRFMQSWEQGINAYAHAVNGLSSGPCTLMHGDAHIRNVAFEDGHEHPVRYYDWQLCARGPAAYDVLFFLATSMNVSDQNLYMDDLLQLYVDELNSYGASYSLAQLEQDLRLAGVSFWGYLGFLGNIFPPDEATFELVRASAPRYTNLVERFDSYSVLENLGR